MEKKIENIQEELEKVMDESEMGNHCSDLYVTVNEKSNPLVENYMWKMNVKRFRNAQDGTIWYDIPFAYNGKSGK